MTLLLRLINAHFPWILMIVLISMQSALSGPVIGLKIGYADKLIHFCTFGVTAWFATRGIAITARKPVKRIWLWIIPFGGAFFAIIDEWHQSLVPGRSPDPADWLADILGVTIFMLLYMKRFPEFFRE